MFTLSDEVDEYFRLEFALIAQGVDVLYYLRQLVVGGHESVNEFEIMLGCVIGHRDAFQARVGGCGYRTHPLTPLRLSPPVAVRTFAMRASTSIRLNPGGVCAPVDRAPVR